MKRLCPKCRGAGIIRVVPHLRNIIKPHLVDACDRKCAKCQGVGFIKKAH
jgi:DnaJ-class molecular chaperone